MAASAYSDEIQQAARVLHLEGLNTREIRERLETGTAGLNYPVSPGARTIDGWRRRWNLEGNRAGYAVREGSEDATEGAIYRRLLGNYRELMSQFEQSVSEGKPDAGILAAVERCQRIVDAARYRRRMGNRAPTDNEIGGETQRTGTGSMLRELAKLENTEPGENP